MRAPTGEQFTIEHEAGGRRWTATITEVAATLRELRFDGIDLVEPFDELERPVKGQGIVLAPWGGRVAGARWEHEGEPMQLAVTEPKTGNAIHGLLRYSPYRLAERTPSSVRLQATIFPTLGWPFLLDTSVTFSLDDDGLTVTHTAVNVGEQRAPWATGAHPYLAVGNRDVSALTLTVPASTAFRADERQIPVEEVAIDAPDSPEPDLRGGRRVADLDIDNNFGGVEFDGDRATSTLLDDEGRGTALWQDRAYPYAVVFTPRNWPDGRGGFRQAAAVEPMSAPGNALNSGLGLVWLEPGAAWQGRWGISPVGL